MSITCPVSPQPEQLCKPGTPGPRDDGGAASVPPLRGRGRSAYSGPLPVRRAPRLLAPFLRGRADSEDQSLPNCGPCEGSRHLD
ncbi:hypothetical protein AAFF_G00435460 [Aldrovandia affinis]|uniref:Uncharacterized protein n=1 Tax=Aldrovandia affinis TaxID=143900 RepID=A0AAD7WI63_9TELE|nr:hypothetical protein AAFF_G00435460 [Aldrovandia affinis]